MAGDKIIWPLLEAVAPTASNAKGPRNASVYRAMLVLKAHEHRWYRSNLTAAEDAAKYVIENAGNLAATPGCGRSTMALLERFAAYVPAIYPCGKYEAANASPA